MTLLQNTAEGGTNGTGVTTSNSGGGSGTAFNAVTVGATWTLTYSTDHAAAGAQSLKAGTSTSGNTDQCFVQYDCTANDQGAARAYVWFTAAPVLAQLASLRSSAGVMVRWQTDSSGKLQLVDSTGTSLYLAGAAAPTGQWIRLELWAKKGTGSSDGQITGAWYLGDSSTAQGTFTTTTGNAGTAQVVHAQVGKISAASGFAATFYLDNVALQDGATGLLGPFVAGNSPPTCTAAASPSSSVEPWSTVALSGTDADSDGTIATRAWTQTGGTSAGTITGASTATATATAPGTIAGDTLTFTYTVTDNGGLTASATTTVAVLPATERAVIGGAEVPMQIRTS